MAEFVLLLAVVGVFLTIFFFSKVHEKHEHAVEEKHHRKAA